MKSLKQVEKEHILMVLKQCGNNKNKAAHVLKICRKTLFNKIKEYQRQKTSTS